MSKTTVRMIAFKDEDGVWQNLNLVKLMNRTLRIEERMTTRVMIESEQTRYNTFCERIEFYAAKILLSGKGKCCDLDGRYLQLLAKMATKNPVFLRESRLSASFVPKERVDQYLRAFAELAEKTGVVSEDPVQKKITFLKEVVRENLNVVEIQLPWQYSGEDSGEEKDLGKLYENFLSLKVSDEISVESGNGPKQALREQFDRVIELTKKKSPASVNFSDLRHDIITEILREYVYKNGTPMYVDVAYGDGSSSLHFPIMTVRNRDDRQLVELRKEPMVNIGMMSERHSNDGLDLVVYGYWYRNQEISIGRTQAETDQVAYQKSKEMFELLRKEGVSRIAFYQTGFQPAVVGFYRALTEELIIRAKQPASLEVVPYYFLGGTYVRGRPWV